VVHSARVADKRLCDPARIGAAADRILRDSGVGRLFHTTIRQGFFAWEIDAEALFYEEELLAGRYVLSTSLTKAEASASQVVRHYRSLAFVERRFRVLKDFLGLRPVHHRLEQRVRAHIAICVIAAVIESLISNDLAIAGVADPDLPEQLMSARRALAELAKIRRHRLRAGREIELVDRPSPLQRQILEACSIDTRPFGKVSIS
jgi:hypothetical protein